MTKQEQQSSFAQAKSNGVCAGGEASISHAAHISKDRGLLAQVTEHSKTNGKHLKTEVSSMHTSQEIKIAVSRAQAAGQPNVPSHTAHQLEGTEWPGQAAQRPAEFQALASIDVSPDPEALNCVSRRCVKGTLHICGNVVVFEPKDIELPVLRAKYKYVQFHV